MTRIPVRQLIPGAGLWNHPGIGRRFVAARATGQARQPQQKNDDGTLWRAHMRTR